MSRKKRLRPRPSPRRRRRQPRTPPRAGGGRPSSVALVSPRARSDGRVAGIDGLSRETRALKNLRRRVARQRLILRHASPSAEHRSVHCHSRCACSTRRAERFKRATGRGRSPHSILTRKGFPQAACRIEASALRNRSAPHARRAHSARARARSRVSRSPCLEPRGDACSNAPRDGEWRRSETVIVSNGPGNGRKRGRS